ncbi:hypothetical protein FRC09_011738, partial [Ceratobasidium sp. 395]
MSKKAKAIPLFESGLRLLQEAANNLDNSNYDALLVLAVKNLDQAARFSEDSGNYDKIYTQVCGSARAACLARVQCDSVIDQFFSISPTMRSLVGSGSHSMDNPSKSATDTIGEDILGGFWSQLNESIEKSITGAHKELSSSEFRGKHWPSFERALTCASGNVELEKFWYGCIATVLYQELDVVLPEKIARCMTAMHHALEPGNPTPSLLSLGEHAPTFSQVASSLQINASAFPNRISYLQSLATYYAHRLRSDSTAFMRLYQLDMDQYRHLENAIRTTEQALEWTRDIPQLTKLRFQLLSAHGYALYKSYSIHHRMDDLENAAVSLREALASKIAPTEELSACRTLLATVLNDLVLSLSEPPDRNPEFFLKSLSIWREIVELTPPDSNGLLAQRLLGQGRAAELMYTSDSGTLAHLVEASGALARAARVEKDPALLVNILFTRARVLSERREHPDFSEWLSVGDAAFRLVEKHPHFLKDETYRAGCVTHADRLLASVTDNAAHGDPKNNVQQLQQAISVLNFLISAGSGNFMVSSFVLSLATTYELLYRVQARMMEPLEKRTTTLCAALDAGEAALKQMKSERRRYQAQACHALIGSVYDELSRLPDQSRSLQTKYNDLAIEHYRLAFNRIGNYIKMTNALEKRYLLHGRRQDLDECVSRLTQQNKGHNTSRQEYYMSSQLVRICLENNIQDKLLVAYGLVFKALRRMSALRHTSEVRYKALTTVSAGYACDAAASALKINDTTAAVELLEQGRGCFFFEQLPIQTDSDYVRSFDSDLAEIIEGKLVKIQEFSRATEGGSSSAQVSSSNFLDEADERMQFDQTPSEIRLGLAVDDLEEALRKVRILPGFQDETQPKPFASLQLAAKSFPIAYINISQFRCDALILRGQPGSTGVLVVPLPTSRAIISGLSSTMQKVVHGQGREFRDANSEESTRHFVRARTGPTPEQQVRSVLRHLWNMITRPVLEALDFIKPFNRLETAPENLPYICWCPMGPLATFLPLHAAGDYDLGPEHWTMSHVISSYTPTVTALARALERQSNSTCRDASILVISQPSSPPTMPLPYVNKEKDAIVAAMSRSKGDGRVTVLHDKAGLMGDTMKLLPTHSILHLACHGKQQQNDPLESAILLHDGELKLSEIIRTKLPSAELVYLSACQTATGDVNTPEESLNLAAGFLFAGYRGAVATMWSINDKDGAEIAKSFYEHLLEYDGPPATNAAPALHSAIRDLVRANPDIGLIR